MELEMKDEKAAWWGVMEKGAMILMTSSPQ